jgi:hypothetical protein
MEHPCRVKPRNEQCDHAGLGGFMGHTCQASATDRNYETSNRIEELRRNAEDLRDKWLRDNGWEHTSSTPGCFWMWRRGEFFCDAATAERVQRIWTVSAYFAAHPESVCD